MQKCTMQDWDNMRIALAVRRNGSIAAAARALGVNYSTVNRRLASYEAALGAKLFERSATGQKCSPFGTRICDAAEQMEQTMLDAERAVVGKDALLQGELRVTMPANFFHTVLAPEIAAFASAFPDIRLSLTFTSDLSDLARREADVAFRFSNNPPETLVGVRIVHCAHAIYASPDYLAQHRDPQTRHWLGWKDRNRRPGWVLESSEPHATIKHHALNDLAQLQMAVHGMGMAVIACFLGDQEPRVVRVPPGKPQPGRDLWILTHEDLRNTARVRALVTFMLARLKQKAPLFEGKLQPDLIRK